MIHQKYEIKASPELVWDALTNPRTIEDWTGSKAIMSDEAGFHFELWDGDIWGENTEVIENELLVQEWYGGEDWDKPSSVTIRLIENGKNTVIELEHDDTPREDEGDLADGWRDYYFGPIKELLET